MRDSERSHGALDPDDWQAFEASLQTVLAASLNKLQAAADGRVWTPPPENLKADLQAPLPKRGMALDELASRLTALLPYGVGNTHPRFFGWVHGAGSPGNMLAELVGAAMNANCGGRDHIAIYVERQVIDWCKSLFQFPRGTSGLIVSGTSMATLIAAKTARDSALDFASRQSGVGDAKLVGYVSEQAHSCLARAFDLVGLGTDALRKIPVTPDYEMDLSALQTQIRRDRKEGFQPFFVTGTVGTVNTAAIDDLDALADIAQQEALWLHVDGAFGACAMASPDLSPRLNGIARADSLAFDFHKWMHVNYDAGCVLIRDGAAHRRAFAARPDYLAADGVALAGGDPWPVDFGPELSRGFRSLKVWAHFHEHGIEKIGQSIAENCALAALLGEKVDEHACLELRAPVSLNICCFRYVVEGMSDKKLDELNVAIVAQLQMDGVAAPSTTRIDDAVTIRVNITNHRTRVEDIDILVDAVLEAGHRLTS